MNKDFEHFGTHDVQSVIKYKPCATNKTKEKPALRQYLKNTWFVVFLLCGMMLHLSSCREIAIIDEFTPDNQQINVSDGNIDFMINFGAYGQDEDVATRSEAADSGPETVVVPLDNGMSMIATLSAASEGVRTRSDVGLRAFNHASLLHIVAYEHSVSGPSYHNHVEFEVDITDDDLIPRLTRVSASPIILDIGKSYRFVAYSYNNNTTAMPAIFPPPGPIGVDPNEVDLIWGVCDTIKVTEPGQQQVTINVNHLFSKVTVHCTSATNITALTDVEMPGYRATFTIDSGKIAPATAVDQPFDFAPGAATTKSSAPRIVYTGETAATVVKVGSVSISGAAQPSYDDLFATFAKKLKSGYAYDLTIHFGDALDLDDDTPPAGFFPYVGAFWKDDQFGERLIRIKRPTSSGTTPADSVWTAVVVTGADWIKLDTIATSDNVWEFGTPSWEGNMAGFDAGPRIVSAGTYVSGYLDNANPAIYFRIGLDGPNPNPGTPRYGMVLLTYANNKKRQRIWIRQGEGLDYLMRPQDAGSGSPWGASDHRPDAVRFSVYNLKDPAENTITDYFDMVDASTGLLGYRGGAFTDYPTKMGYFFEWNYTTKAFNPFSSAIANGNSSAFGPDFWLSATDETCPPGYRRPNDGPNNTTAHNTNAYVTDSEMRQSLWLNPQTGNTNNTQNYVFGYYADGFFDRREIVSSSVSADNSQAAFIGGLFYNPKNYASLFFPSGGIRTSHNLNLVNKGVVGCYWSSSSSSLSSALELEVQGTQVIMNGSPQRNNGLSVRCVEAVCVSVTSVSVSPSSGSTTVGGKVMLTATPTPGGASDLFYQWEYSLDGGTTWINTGASGPTNTSYNAIAMIEGVVHYRVTVFNACNSVSSAAVPITGTGGIEPTSPLEMYVGAFWKSNQRGERLIRITRPTTGDQTIADGMWTATVYGGANWIVLDKNNSPDGGVWLPGGPNINGDDGTFENGTYNIIGSATSVSGTLSASNPEIYFRIGLTSPIASNTQRYGMVLLIYKNGERSHRIFIRQGEEPDYLMRPTDGGRGDQAVRFSPYNLTAAALDAAVSPYGLSGQTNPAAIFTQYPSQSGAVFQFANATNMRFAYNAYATGTASGWNSTAVNTGFWTSGIVPTRMVDIYETCPPEYRRPNNGVTNAGTGTPSPATTSEMQQSLYLNPVTTSNVIYGYYADGFFDRRQIVASPTGTAAASVSAGSTLAHRGGLFFNPDNYASLFFPAAGYRNTGNGTLTNTGVSGYYWSNSGTAAGNGWRMLVGNNVTDLTASVGDYGYSVRCVKEPYEPVFRVVPQDYEQVYNDATGSPALWVNYDSYLLDGSTYTLKVYSNRAWRVKSINGNTFSPAGLVGNQTAILSPKPGDNLAVGANGVGAVVTGEDLLFSVVSNTRLWADMTIVFESPTGEFADYTLDLIFALRRLVLLGVGGSDAIYCYNLGNMGNNTNGDNNARKMLSHSEAFGVDMGTMVYSRGFDFYRVSNLRTNSNWNTVLSLRPDVIQLSYPLVVNATDAQNAVTYLNGGGVLLAFIESNVGNERLLQEVFNDPVITTALAGTAGAVYPITNSVNDVITNGLFGDLRGLQWGEDASTTVRVSNFGSSASQVTVYSLANDISGNSQWPSSGTPDPVMFRHNTLPFFYIGDGGFLSSRLNVTDHQICPFRLDYIGPGHGNGNVSTGTFMPVPRPDFGKNAAASPLYNVYNSQLFANIMIWALTEAQGFTP